MIGMTEPWLPCKDRHVAEVWARTDRGYLMQHWRPRTSRTTRSSGLGWTDLWGREGLADVRKERQELPPVTNHRQMLRTGLVGAGCNLLSSATGGEDTLQTPRV